MSQNTFARQQSRLRRDGRDVAPLGREEGRHELYPWGSTRRPKRRGRMDTWIGRQKNQKYFTAGTFWP
jgi:hypothetical protein